ncbi:hypothetical protein IE53DRAFT_262090 [Violaceomyces palustris]|uniref:Uncharacterized protein n=1 Tax=Violaceomyces palustris TaxID=1673888 RepID=A0ACD0P3G5_9BASI|nr:hypothetical protein IE53DRAFT_262090 [Violaceomyces palustris]
MKIQFTCLLAFATAALALASSDDSFSAGIVQRSSEQILTVNTVPTEDKYAGSEKAVVANAVTQRDVAASAKTTKSKGVVPDLIDAIHRFSTRLPEAGDGQDFKDLIRLHRVLAKYGSAKDIEKLYGTDASGSALFKKVSNFISIDVRDITIDYGYEEKAVTKEGKKGEKEVKGLGHSQILKKVESKVTKEFDPEQLGTLPAFLKAYDAKHLPTIVKLGIKLMDESPKGFLKALGDDKDALDILDRIKAAKSLMKTTNLPDRVEGLVGRDIVIDYGSVEKGAKKNEKKLIKEGKGLPKELDAKEFGTLPAFLNAYEQKDYPTLVKLGVKLMDQSPKQFLKALGDGDEAMALLKKIKVTGDFDGAGGYSKKFKGTGGTVKKFKVIDDLDDGAGGVLKKVKGAGDFDGAIGLSKEVKGAEGLLSKRKVGVHQDDGDEDGVVDKGANDGNDSSTPPKSKGRKAQSHTRVSRHLVKQRLAQ